MHSPARQLRSYRQSVGCLSIWGNVNLRAPAHCLARAHMSEQANTSHSKGLNEFDRCHATDAAVFSHLAGASRQLHDR